MSIIGANKHLYCCDIVDASCNFSISLFEFLRRYFSLVVINWGYIQLTLERHALSLHCQSTVVGLDRLLEAYSS